ncbi:PREDICTED: protein MEMO1-like [Amphimedon queenslandica]|uniref:Mediator of ErbB2-driven cell motility 1 n=1 Tax=Amphimedon queenslandica TaxID=400682 RepID=A0A1X7V614_AMPQE|nr:PREDICTED: protein MEMO1-like [Amphimedon queenslandica]|eukprot:XP_003385587.1 PREDICTED: protein MEMO1-like [Amphimedon queenslandica]
MTSTRKASHAGSWYSGSGDKLTSQLEEWLGKATSSGAKHAPARAIIAPHAGYSYSGPCAAYAYNQIIPAGIKRVFILGPSHHKYMPDCALSACSHYETPLYNLEIDREIYHSLYSTGKFSQMDVRTDEDEHSIEMHLPYIAKVMESKRGSFTIVPILVGALKPDKEAEYGQLLHKYLLDEQNLFVISSDFCHWGKRFQFTYYDKEHGPIHSSIEALDRMGMSLIEALDTKGFQKYLQTYRNTICGRHPIGVLLNAIDAAQGEKSFVLKFTQYAQSNRCTAASDSSVSYASASVVVPPDT